MEEIIILCLCFVTILLLRYFFKINIIKAKELEENKELEKITDRFPDNVNVAKEILQMLDNKDVQIEEAKNTKTSLYIATTNKIIIADIKNNYARIQTIAHECLHSVQDRKLLIFNFAFSNMTMIYWIVSIFLTICNVFTNTLLQMFILLLLLFIQTTVRAYLETDAMTKSKFLAKEYIKNKDLCTKDELQELLIEYEKINNLGIPFYIYRLVTSSLIKIIIYIIILFL